MANRDVVLIGLESGLGAQMLDANTGNVIYDTPGRNDTDEVEWLGVINDEIVTIGYDSQMNIYSKDFVHRLYVELGKSRRGANTDYLNRRIVTKGADEFYILSRISDTDPASTQPSRTQIDRRSWITGALLESVTTDISLYDEAFSSSCIEGPGAGLAWDSTSMWSYVSRGTHEGKLVRISLLTGEVLETLDTTAGGTLEIMHSNNMYSFLPGADEFNQFAVFLGTSQLGEQVFKAYKIDLVNKTVTPAAAECNPATLPGTANFSGIYARTNYRIWLDFVNSSIKTVIDSQPDSGVPAMVATFNFDTGVISTTPLTVMRHNNPALPVENWNMFSFNSDASKVALYSEYSGYALYDLTGDALIAQKDYRSTSDETNDGIYTEAMLYTTLPEKVITGSVQVAGAGEALPVAIYDQDSLQLLRKTVSAADGTYSLGHFSDSPKFVVAASPDATANFKVSAHLTGV